MPRKSEFSHAGLWMTAGGIVLHVLAWNLFTACAVARVPCVSRIVCPLDPSVLFSSGAVSGHTCSCTWQVWVPRDVGREGLAVECPCPSFGTCGPSTEASQPPVPGTVFICALGSTSGRAGGAALPCGGHHAGGKAAAPLAWGGAAVWRTGVRPGWDRAGDSNTEQNCCLPGRSYHPRVWIWLSEAVLGLRHLSPALQPLPLQKRSLVLCLHVSSVLHLPGSCGVDRPLI